MRLRRETGDWTIKFDGNSKEPKLLTSQLPKGLNAEDFIGAVIEMDCTDTEESGVSHMQLTTANDVLGRAFSVACPLSKGDKLYYDRRSGHLSLDPTDFDPVEPDEGGEDVTGFVITRNGSAYTVTPSTVTFTQADSQKYTTPWQKFIGKTVTDADGVTHTITEEMIGPSSGNGVPLYFVNPTDKSGNHLLLTSSGSGSTFPMVMTVTYSNWT